MILLPTRLAAALQDAYALLVKGFGKTGSSTAPGPGATVQGMKPASYAQKLWRFCCDPRVEFSHWCSFSSIPVSAVTIALPVPASFLKRP